MRVLLVGPSSRTTEMDKDYFEKKRDQGFIIVSYTGSIKYLQDIGFTPDYYSFMDPLTIGSRIEDYEKDPYFRNISLLTADLYKNDLKTFFSHGFTCNKLMRRQDLFNRFKTLKFTKNFKKVVVYGPEVVDIRNKDMHIRYQNFKDNLIIYSGFGSFNIDKFACYLLPLVFRNFGDIEKIRCVGFGDFSSERIERMPGTLYSGKSMDGYDSFKRTSQMIAPVLKEYMQINEIDISFEHENWFSKLFTPRN